MEWWCKKCLLLINTNEGKQDWAEKKSSYSTVLKKPILQETLEYLLAITLPHNGEYHHLAYPTDMGCFGKGMTSIPSFLHLWLTLKYLTVKRPFADHLFHSWLASLFFIGREQYIYAPTVLSATF